MFESVVVKELMKQANTIGEVHVKASPADAASVVADDFFREQLRNAFRAASAEVGEAKAMKKAVKAARDAVELYSLNTGVTVDGRLRLQNTVESALHVMLGP